MWQIKTEYLGVVHGRDPSVQRVLRKILPIVALSDWDLGVGPIPGMLRQGAPLDHQDGNFYIREVHPLRIYLPGLGTPSQPYNTLPPNIRSYWNGVRFGMMPYRP